MGFKTVEKGIYSYYKNSDKDKKHLYYYYSTTDSNGKTVRVRSQHTDIRNVRTERNNTNLRDRDRKPLYSEMTLDQIVEAYISPRSGLPMREKDKLVYVKHIAPVLGKKKAVMITETQVAQLKAGLSVKPRNIMIMVKSLLKFAGNTIKVDVDRPNQKRKHFFTDEQLNILFDLAEHTDKELLFFMQMLLYTGQRPQNVLDLNVGDVDLLHNRIDFSEIKGQQAEYIPISSKLRPHLEAWIIDKKGRLFSKTYDRLQKIAQKIFDYFNRELYYIDGMSREEEKTARTEAHKTQRHKWATFYSLRHTAAVNIIKNTGSVYKAQQILRHSDISMTQAYAQLIDSDKQGAVDAI